MRALGVIGVRNCTRDRSGLFPILKISYLRHLMNFSGSWGGGQITKLLGPPTIFATAHLPKLWRHSRAGEKVVLFLC
jgi:hypothetical protein